MRAGLLPHPRTSAALVALWLLLAGSVEPGQLLLAGLAGWALPLAGHRLVPARPAVRRLEALLRLLAMLARDVVVANLVVARLVLGPARRLRPGFVIVPLALRDPGQVAVLAAVLTLTPGSVSVAYAAARRELTVHFLHVEDAAREAQLIKDRYEKTIAEVFGCSLPH